MERRRLLHGEGCAGQGVAEEADGRQEAADMSERSARKWQTGLYPSVARKPHRWRNRPDPFGRVFEEEVAPLLPEDEQRVL